MARPVQWPPTIQEHKASGRSRIRVRGREYWLGKTGSAEAKAEYARLVVLLAGGGAPPPRRSGTPATVADVAAAWWAHAEQTYDPRGRELAQHRYALAPLVRLFGPTPAADFGVRQLALVQRAMADGSWETPEEKAAAAKKGQPAGWCKNVVNRRVVRIRTAWRWAEQRGLVPPGSYGHLRTLPGLRQNDRSVRQTARRKPASREDLDRVAAHCPPAVAAMLELQWLVGMRSGEVRILRPGDLDRGGAGGCWLYRPGFHKGDWRDDDTGRVVPLGPRCQAVLAPFLLTADGPGGYAFRPKGTRRPGEPYTAHGYAQAVRRAAKKAGVVGFHAYRLRHSAKERIAREAGLDAARQILGQRSVQTAEHYGGLDVQNAAAVAGRLG